MIQIDDKLISEEIFPKNLFATLQNVKVHVVWKEMWELRWIKTNLRYWTVFFDKIKPYLTQEGIKALEEQEHGLLIRTTECMLLQWWRTANVLM